MIQQHKMSRGTNILLPVLPKNLIDVTTTQFGDLIVTQCILLLTSYTQNDIIGLENEFKQFKQEYEFKQFKQFKQQLRADHKFCETVQQMDDYISFDDGQSTISSRNLLLCNFFDGVFLGTSTLESNFSLIGYQKDNCHSSLPNFSLEKILQCK